MEKGWLMQLNNSLETGHKRIIYIYICMYKKRKKC